MKRVYTPRSALWLSVLLLGARLDHGRGQGATDPLYVLETGGSAGLVSADAPLDLRGSVAPLFLDFRFGFATDEVVGPGQFLDAFTISVASSGNAAQTAIYLTVDAGGLVIAPPTPGGIPLDPASLAFASVAYPESLPQFQQRVAYQVLAPVPDVLLGQEARLYFDLFDNANGVPSLGWASGVSIVPEPSSGLLCLLGVAVWRLWKRLSVFH